MKQPHARFVGVAVRYNFTRAQQREMWERCHVDGEPRCECIRPVIVRAVDGKTAVMIAPGGVPVSTGFFRCSAPLYRGKFRYDHTDPTYIAARRVTAADGQVICDVCDKEKYSRVDRPKIDKVRRLSDRASGIKKPQRKLMPGSRGSGVRKKYDRATQRFVTVRE